MTLIPSRASLPDLSLGVGGGIGIGIVCFCGSIPIPIPTPTPKGNYVLIVPKKRQMPALP
jgi:hypothetical protein